VDSPEWKNLQEFSTFLIKAIADYKTALKIWRDKIEYSSLAKKHESELDRLQQLCWFRASIWIQKAETLLDPNKVENALAEHPDDKVLEEDLDAKADKILLDKWP
jgi:flagellar biosynthesis chaperone FliJ